MTTKSGSSANETLLGEQTEPATTTGKRISDAATKGKVVVTGLFKRVYNVAFCNSDGSFNVLKAALVAGAIYYFYAINTAMFFAILEFMIVASVVMFIWKIIFSSNGQA